MYFYFIGVRVRLGRVEGSRNGSKRLGLFGEVLLSMGR